MAGGNPPERFFGLRLTGSAVQLGWPPTNGCRTRRPESLRKVCVLDREVD